MENYLTWSAGFRIYLKVIKAVTLANHLYKQ